MNKGSVNLNKSEVVISFQINLYPTHFEPTNILSSLEWIDAIEHIKSSVDNLFV